MPDTIQTLANRIASEHGFAERAVAELEVAIRENQDLVAEAVHNAAVDAIERSRYYVREVIEGERDGMREEAERPNRISPEMRASLRGNIGRYYGWVLRDGSLLGDADRNKVAHDAAIYGRVANAHQANSWFLEMVAKKMKNGEKVRDAWDEDELARLMKTAKKKFRRGGGKGGDDDEPIRKPKGPKGPKVKVG